jgi:hypothetical protein
MRRATRAAPASAATFRATTAASLRCAAYRASPAASLRLASRKAWSKACSRRLSSPVGRRGNSGGGSGSGLTVEVPRRVGEGQRGAGTAGRQPDQLTTRRANARIRASGWASGSTATPQPRQFTSSQAANTSGGGASLRTSAASVAL